MIKLLVIGDLDVRGVSVSRAFSLERLTENGYPVTVKVRNKYPTDFDLEWCDVVFFLRALSHQDLQFIKHVKVLGKKIWIDSDDDLLNIPIDHRNYFDWNNESAKEAHIEIHRIADYITYSTKYLQNAYKKYNPKSSLISCGYADEMMDSLISSQKKPQKIIMWRGTDTHEKSLLEFAPSILKVANANPDWAFYFLGFKPWYILEKMKNSWRVEPFMDVDDMLRFMNQLAPAINMVVRTDNEFTKARSCVSFVEATLAGAVTVAPNWEEWKKPGIVNYKNKVDFISKMNSTIKEYGKKTRIKKSIAHVQAFNGWKKMNETQYGILSSLMGK